VPRGRHREESGRRPLPRLPRLLIAASIAAALLAVALTVTFWPNTGSAPTAHLVTTVDDGTPPALSREARISRDKIRPPVPTTSVAQPPAVVGQLWTTTDVTVRSGPSADHDRIGTLNAVTQVDVTGVTEQGWAQVLIGQRTGWVKSSYLSKSKPKPASTPSGVSNAPCPISSSIEPHLTTKARAVYRAVCAAFRSTVTSFGGYRAGDSGDHGSGKAVDIMVSGDPGWAIARYVQAHARELGVSYVIYQQKIWLAGNPTSQWKLMEDRGSITANHYNHVHVSVS
jgi:uncharacterized protein YraI